MSGISTGIGLLSGINTASLIDQLIAIEGRPVRTLEARVQAADVQRTAFLSLSAQLLGIKNSILGMKKSSFFQRFSSISSNSAILTARTDETAVPGSQTFRVRSLVANHSLISRGFADSNTTPIGVGMLTIEVGHGMVNESNRLDALNGGQGIERGIITITDKDGETAEIDLTGALTVDDVLRAINTDTTINVRATVTSIASTGGTGDRIVIEDLTGGLGSLIISDNDGGSTAADLGIVGVAAGLETRIEGRDLVRLSNGTLLSVLNDGNGVGRLAGGTDLVFETVNGNFDVSLTSVLASQPETDLRMLNSGNGIRLGTIRITDRAGQSVEINLADSALPPLRTVQDVRQRITDAAAQAGVSISFAIVNSHFQITDTSDVDEDSEATLTVEDVAVDGEAGHAAADLGITGSVEGSSIIGRDIFRVSTIGDVINAINYAQGNIGFVEARISDSGDGITLTAPGLPGDTVTIVAGEGSTAARDLGLLDVTFDTTFETHRLIAGLNTVLLKSLNGGQGIELGQITLTDRSGNSTAQPIDFTDAQTLQDVIDLINQDTSTSIVASVNAAGNGIQLRDTSNGSGPLIVTDVSGTTAAALGLGGSHALADGATVDGGNLQLQYISTNTLLSDLNAGQGVQAGTFRITDSLGGVYSINITTREGMTVGDVIDAINNTSGLPATIEARINDTGDGIVIIDTSDGNETLSIEDIDGRVAADLNLVGTAKAGQNLIDGSFEVRIEVGAGDTLETIVKKINEAGGGFSASIINDGGSVSPYSLTLTSTVTGRRGELVVDAEGLDFGFGTLSQASDAVIMIGSGANSKLITSSNNTLELGGVTLDLQSVSDEEVTISVSQDIDAIVEDIKKFTDLYNDVQGAIDDVTRFNPDTFVRGTLQGDRTVGQIRTRLHRTILSRFDGLDESFSRLFSVGLRIGANNRLEFNEEKFREAYTDSPQDVEALFGTEETGFAAVLDDVLDELTREFDGVIARRGNLLDNQQELLNDRIENLNLLLDAKRSQLEAQFLAMEKALAVLQGQQNALGTLAQLAGSLT